MAAAVPPCAPLTLCCGCRGDPVARPYLQPGHRTAVASGACQGDPSEFRGCAASPGLRAGRRERKEERKRKEKRPNTSSHRKGSGKGSGKLNRRVQTFFGKAPQGPAAVPWGWLSLRGRSGAERALVMAEPGGLPAPHPSAGSHSRLSWVPPAATGTDRSTGCSPASWRLPGHRGTGTAPQPRNWRVWLPRGVTCRTCPQGGHRLVPCTQLKWLRSNGAFCHAVHWVSPRIQCCLQGKDVAAREGVGAQGGLSQSHPAASSLQCGDVHPAHHEARLPRPRVTHKQSCLGFFTSSGKKKKRKKSEREKSDAQPPFP